MLKPFLPVWAPSFGMGYNSHNSYLIQFVNVLCSPAFREGKGCFSSVQVCLLFHTLDGAWFPVHPFSLSQRSLLTAYEVIDRLFPLFFLFSLSPLKAPFRNRRRSVAMVNSRPRLAFPRTNEHSLRLTLPLL